MFLAAEILRTRRETLTWRYPVAVASGFGLLHGLGFAAALREIGLPQTETPIALVAFNIGIETGQLLFVGLCAGAWQGLRIAECRTTMAAFLETARLRQPLVYAIGGISAFWFMNQLTGA